MTTVQMDARSRADVDQLLGRQARGLESIERRGADGAPLVIRVASLVDGKPFPTLYWLVGAELCHRIDQLEAAGVIARLQARINTDLHSRTSLAVDHWRYAQAREQYMSVEVRDALQRCNWLAPLRARGIGGVSDFSRIRCLHMFYAAHLLQPNIIGCWLDSEFL